MDAIKKIIAETFNDIADGIKSGSFNKKVRIGLTTFGSEHGVEEMVKAAKLAKRKYNDFDIVLIGPKVDCEFEIIEALNVEDGHKKMIELLDNKVIQGCVTKHFDFPIGVSTVGRVITPGKGNELIIATTTGTTSTNRVEGMIKNTIAGIATAKALGIKTPTVGILNIDGARSVERGLKELKSKGYEINFADSLREDGGAVMRGNDLLSGTPDVMVCDSLTGNLLVKMFSSFTTGGDYETLGYGYGPGVGENYDRLINIISRASGAPLVCDALKYCAVCAQNNLMEISKCEFEIANKFGLSDITFKISNKEITPHEEISVPPKKVVTYQISGIDILELDNACKALWKNQIYSESGMGCTGPIVLVNEEDGEKAKKILNNLGIK